MTGNSNNLPGNSVSPAPKNMAQADTALKSQVSPRTFRRSDSGSRKLSEAVAVKEFQKAHFAKSDAHVYNPGSKRILFWNISIFFVSLYLFAEIPFRLATRNSGSPLVQILIEIILLIDIYFRYNHFGVIIRSTPCLKRKTIRKLYARGWMSVDALTALPFWTFSLVYSPLNVLGDAVHILRLIRLHSYYVKIKYFFEDQSGVGGNDAIRRMPLIVAMMSMMCWLGGSFYVGIREIGATGTDSTICFTFFPPSF